MHGRGRWLVPAAVACGAGHEQRLRIRLTVREPFAQTDWSACSEAHAQAATGLLRWANAHALFLQTGILGTLALFLLAGLALALGRPLAGATYSDLSAFFRLAIAVTVLPLGWHGARGHATPGGPLRSPFPLHIQALIGSAAVVWLFRLVGLVWLITGLRHFVSR